MLDFVRANTAMTILTLILVFLDFFFKFFIMLWMYFTIVLMPNLLVHKFTYSPYAIIPEITHAVVLDSHQYPAWTDSVLLCQTR